MLSPLTSAFLKTTTQNAVSHGCIAKLSGDNAVEILGNDISEHYIITFDDQRQPEVDIIFILPNNGEYFG